MNPKPSEMIEELQKELHGISADRLLFWMNQEQDFIEKLREDWKFCIVPDQTISGTDALGSDYDLPADFDHFLAVVNTTDDKPMTEKSLNWLRKHDPDRSSTGSPDWYVLLGPQGTDDVEQVRFVDDLDDDYTVTYDYYRKLPALDNDPAVDTPSLIPCDTILMLWAEIRGRIDNEEAEDGPVVSFLQQRYATLLNALITHNTFKPNKARRIKADHRVTFGGYKYL